MAIIQNLKQEKGVQWIREQINECYSLQGVFRALTSLNRDIYPREAKELKTLLKELNITIKKKDKPKRYCLNCGKEIIGKDKRQKFCSQHCSATYNNKIRKRKTIKKEIKSIFARVNKLHTLSKEDLYQMLIVEGISCYRLAKELKCCPKTVKKYAEKLGIDLSSKKYSVYDDKQEPKYCLECGKPIRKCQVYCSQECCIKHKKEENYKHYLEHQEEFTGNEITYAWLKPHILEEQDNHCAICGCEPIHNGKELHFIMDHIDGDAKNNRRDNLRMICPNCDSQLETFKSRNKGRSTRDYLPYAQRKKNKQNT